jgi:hypothetical protein
MFVGYGVVADLMALRLNSPPIVDPGGLGHDEEKGRVQMTLIEFRNGDVEMHGAGVIKRQRQCGHMTVPG